MRSLIRTPGSGDHVGVRLHPITQKARKAVFQLAVVSLSFVFGCASAALGGDILRGGASAASARQNAAARVNAGNAAAAARAAVARDRLARTTRAVEALSGAQAAARAAASGARDVSAAANVYFPAVTLNEVPNGLAPGGLEVATGPDARWTGANLPKQSGNIVTIKQNQSQALLNWKTFNVGSQTTVNFDQTLGGNDIGKWIAFNYVLDPSGAPSRILGQINAGGQVYVMNQNGIIFGGTSQVNTRTLVASSLPLNRTLRDTGLLNLQSGAPEFLFSSTIQSGTDDPLDPDRPVGRIGDLVVLPGAQLTSTLNPEGGGGRVMLVAPNVYQGGSISTPSGQTILAAGLQVGAVGHQKNFPAIPGRKTDPSTGEDASLRGLDVYVGDVGDYGGTVKNSGLISIQTGSLLMVGKNVSQGGIVDSTTTVALNGRIDLLASYGARPNSNYNPASAFAPPFLSIQTGTLRLEPGSISRIIPDYSSLSKTVGTKLPLKSQINLLGRDIFLGSGSTILAPNADIALVAGLWRGEGATEFMFTSGQVYLDRGALIDASGSSDVRVPLANSILKVQLRGNELAVSPLQRGGAIRGVDLTIDIRRTGRYNGRYWIGTPLGDAAAFADIIEKDVAQLTAAAGSVLIRAGSAFVQQRGSVIDVSGGYFVNEGGRVQTTRLLYQGRHIIDIADATPDRVYDGIFTARFTKTQEKWGVSRTWNSPLAPLGAYTQREYIAGADGGELSITAPAMALDGELLGKTVIGPRQLRKSQLLSELPQQSILKLNFTSQSLITDSGGLSTLFTIQPKAPTITFGAPPIGVPAPPFVPENPSPLPESRVLAVSFPENFYQASGFGEMEIENSEGDFIVPATAEIKLPPYGALTATGRNIRLLGRILAPGGTLNFRAFNLPPYETAIYKATNPAGAPLLQPDIDPSSGSIILLGSSVLDVSGLIVDDRRTAPLNLDPQPFAIAGGSISLVGYNVILPRGSVLDASGGIGVSAKGRYSYGNGGSIRIEAGQDVNYPSVTGGKLDLFASLRGYSGATGGTLSIKAPLIQIGGAPLHPSTLLLSPDFFNQGGFSRFELTGIGLPAPGAAFNPSDPDAPAPMIPAVFVAPGTVVEPRVESVAFVPFPTGAGHGESLLRRQVRPLGLRGPVSISLFSKTVRNDFSVPELGLFGNPGDVVAIRGDILIDRGAKIITEPGGSFEARGSTVTVLGALTVPGGSIRIVGDSSFPLNAIEQPFVSFGRPTVYIGPSARISAAGASVILPDRYGRRDGIVYPGGSINVSGNIVAAAGAILDVSGTADTFEIHPSRLALADQTKPPLNSGLNSLPFALRTVPFRVESNGGSITLAGMQMLFTDATLLGKPGGKTAVGGYLSISSGRFYGPGADARSSDINLTVTQGGATIPSSGFPLGIGRPVRDGSGAVIDQMGYFTVERFIQGGFSSLDLGMAAGSNPLARGGNVFFKGPVEISAQGFLRLASGGIIRTDSRVNFSAPYISIGQVFRPPPHPSDPEFIPFEQVVAGLQATELVVPEWGPGEINFSASLIDVGTTVLKNTRQATFSAPSGDIRGNGALQIAGRLDINAGQIYPTTLGAFHIAAFDSPDGPGRVNITRVGSAPAPLSAGGRLAIHGSIINQGGVLMAPFGSITIGWDGIDLDPSTPAFDRPVNPVGLSALNIPVSQAVTLLAGSLTSVAGIDYRNGSPLYIPFGYSPDGLVTLDPRGVDITTQGLPEKRVGIAGNSITLQSGAVVDIRGGGELFSTRWVNGLGGPVNLLGEASRTWSDSTSYQPGDLVLFNGRTYSARVAINPNTFPGQAGPTPGINRYWTFVEESFAVVPGYNQKFAPYAPFNTSLNAARLGGIPGYVSSSLRIGDQIYLDSGSGLLSGSYTLLPRQYAVLPGAYLITPKESGPYGTYTTPEGATFVTGYRFNAFNQPRAFSELRSRFEVASADVISGRVQYNTYDLSEFLSQAAAKLEIPEAQRLPRDSGYLLFSGNTAMSLQGTVLSRPLAQLGRGSMIDIASFADITIVGDRQTAPGSVVLNAGIISGFGAESLIIGGIRRQRTDGNYNIEVRSQNITLDNAGTPLQGPDILLAARRSLTLQPGSQLLVSGARTEPADTYFFTGDGVAARVSADPSASIFRSDVTASTLPLLTIGAGAQIGGAGVTLDSSYGFDLNSTGSILAEELTFGAGQIAVVLSPTAAFPGQIVIPQLVLEGGLLDGLKSIRQLNLIAYQNTIDIYGPGSFGESLGGLSLQAGEIRGFNQGAGSSIFRATEVEISNPRNIAAPGPINAPTGSLVFNADTVRIGAGDSILSQYSNAIFNAPGGMLFSGTGSLFAQENIVANTSLITAGQGARQNLIAGGTLTLNSISGEPKVAPGLGGTLNLRGTSVTSSVDIIIPSGLVDVRATGAGGDLIIGGLISTKGRAFSFYDITKYTNGGEIRLAADDGDVILLPGSDISVSADPGGGDAGFVTILAPKGQFEAEGLFEGLAGAGGKGGEFKLDTESLASFDTLRDLLNLGGFTESRDIRVRTGSITIAGVTTARRFRLVADTGSVIVTGTINAAGETGGEISLISRGDLTLQNGSVLSVAAQRFSNAGKGGNIYLEAGASTGGTSGPGVVDIQLGSLLDLSVAAFQQGATALPNGDYRDPTSSAFLGQFRGTLHIRAPRIGPNDVAVNKIFGTISEASSILVEANRIYTPAGGILNTPGNAFRASVDSDNSAFITAFELVNSSKLLGGTVNAGLDPITVVAPGVEIINPSGDLVLGLANNTPLGSTDVRATTAGDWNLATWRYGSKRAPGVLTLRAAGDIYFNNALSDGFSGVPSTAASGHSSLWLGELLDIDRDGLGNLYRPINLQSWSYRITAGADISSGGGSVVDPTAATGSVFVGEFYPPVPNPNPSGGAVAVGDSGLTANSIRISTTATDRGTRYEVIRTGTGTIDVNAALDVQLRNQFATIYTAGVRIPNPENLFGTNDFRLPEFPSTAATHPAQGGLGAVQQFYGPIVNFGSGTRRTAQYATSGGSIRIAAGRDAGRYTFIGSQIVQDSSRQMPTNWLYRRGYVNPLTGTFGAINVPTTIINDTSASLTWWVDYSNFFQGVGALGGGDVSIRAGGNIENLDAFTVTNARMSGRDATLANIAPNEDLLLELGGGDLSIVAGRDIDGGVYYVERGLGRLRAGGQIKTNQTRSATRGILANPTSPDLENQLTWLPTTLFLGKGGFDVSASGNVLLGPVSNLFLLPQGLNNKFWYKTYFNTYGKEASVSVTSTQGSITLRNVVQTSSGGTSSPLQLWFDTQNRNVPASDENASYYQPWIRLAETEVVPFSRVTALQPPRFFATAISGEINLQGDLTLFPSPTGTLELIAGNNMNGLAPIGVSAGLTSYVSSAINVSDADPGRLRPLTNPFSYFSVAPTPAQLRTTGLGIYDDFDLSLSESGSFTGVEASIGRKGARHASGILHASNTEPVRLYTGSGDISGFTLFTPKFTQVVAGNNLTDVGLYLQNANPDSVSIISAGKDIIPFNENTPLRVTAQLPGNVLINALRPRIDGTISNAMAGDIQINGPGVLEVIAGRNLDLGSSEKFTDGTGAGITSIGRNRNPFLPFESADLVILAGVRSPSDGPTLGLRGSALDFENFIAKYITGGAARDIMSLHEKTRKKLLEFDQLSAEQQAVVALDVFYALLRQAAAEQAETGSYASGFEAIEALYGSGSYFGEVFTRTRDIRSTSGSSITIAAPGGGMTMASTLTTSTLTPPGVVTEFGGPVDIFLKDSLDIGATRIFTLRGGDLTIWSSEGDIAAGSAAKTVVTAPPTRVTLDASSAEVLTDLGGLATGGGIGVLAAVEGVQAGNVFLLAPAGTVDAGDAGIRATGDITIAATTVLNADNIAAGGTSVGVPTAPAVAAPNVAGLSSGANAAAASNAAGERLSQQAGQQPSPVDDSPSVIVVEVLGYGGGPGIEEQADDVDDASASGAGTATPTTPSDAL